jgi:hypothetical protein
MNDEASICAAVQTGLELREHTFWIQMCLTGRDWIAVTLTLVI